ncbi:hypothetical protein FHX80_111783 [Streptomyces brevispora]|uniref:Uncharacterized protein n=1 Tax=Streptomyces brevispora TaxID=887462 RepID=A0A561UVG7_9ACTN|nr:hypothetical protein FHX80_111783 [Streptomyces brevispora]
MVCDCSVRGALGERIRLGKNGGPLVVRLQVISPWTSSAMISPLRPLPGRYQALCPGSWG